LIGIFGFSRQLAELGGESSHVLITHDLLPSPLINSHGWTDQVRKCCRCTAAAIVRDPFGIVDRRPAPSPYDEGGPSLLGSSKSLIRSVQVWWQACRALDGKRS